MNEQEFNGDLNLKTFPAEILLYIFEFTISQFDPARQAPSIEVGDRSPWAIDLRMKKALVRVCKRWRNIGISCLYHRAFIHRVGQLIALVKVLEGTPACYDGAPYSSWIHHVHGFFHVNESWEAVYFDHVVRLLTLCTSIRSFLWRIEWAPPYSNPISARCSTVNLMLLSHPSIQPTLRSLQTLTFTLNKWNKWESIELPNDGNDYDHLTFENLEDLTCEAVEPSLLDSLNFVSQSFIVPRLRKLTIRVLDSQRDATSFLGKVFAVVKSHGRKLAFLELDLPSVTTIFSLGITEILSSAPNLQSLRCSCLAFPPIDPKSTTTNTTYPELLRIDIFTTAIFSKREILERYLVMASARKLFPSLHTVGLFDQTFSKSSVLLDGVTPPPLHAEAFEFLQDWTKKLHELGIAFVGVDDEPVAPSSADRWTGRHTTFDNNAWMIEEVVHSDPEDLSFDSDGMESKDESSEYSSWDSEPEDVDWESDSFKGEVGSVEALEIFESTVEDTDGTLGESDENGC